VVSIGSGAAIAFDALTYLVAAGFVLRYVRPSRWRFTERAYTAWLGATLNQDFGGAS
jgi:hypothetical protein